MIFQTWALVVNIHILLHWSIYLLSLNSCCYTVCENHSVPQESSKYWQCLLSLLAIYFRNHMNSLLSWYLMSNIVQMIWVQWWVIRIWCSLHHLSGHQQVGMTQGHQDMKVCFSGFLIIKTRLKHTNLNQMSFSFWFPIELFCIHSQENINRK